MTSAFFGQGAVRLLKTLTANNTKAFFDARRADYRGERIGAVSGAIWSDVISIFIVIATAAAIGGTGPLQSARQAAEALTPVVGPAAPQLFAFGLLGASLLAASVVPLSTSYAIADATGAPRSVSKSLRGAPLFYGIFTLQIVECGRRHRN